MVSQKSRKAKRSQWNDSITIKANLYSLCSSAPFPFTNWLSLPLLIVFIFCVAFLVWGLYACPSSDSVIVHLLYEKLRKESAHNFEQGPEAWVIGQARLPFGQVPFIVMSCPGWGWGHLWYSAWPPEYILQLGL